MNSFDCKIVNKENHELVEELCSAISLNYFLSFREQQQQQIGTYA